MVRHFRVSSYSFSCLLLLGSAELLAQEGPQEPDKDEVKEVIEDAIEEHRPWWMPRESRDPVNRMLPDSGFRLQVEEDKKLTLDEVVLQIRRTYEGRVVRAVETDDGFVVRLLLKGGRLRTLHISPEGAVVRAKVED